MNWIAARFEQLVAKVESLFTSHTALEARVSALEKEFAEPPYAPVAVAIVVSTAVPLSATLAPAPPESGVSVPERLNVPQPALGVARISAMLKL